MQYMETHPCALCLYNYFIKHSVSCYIYIARNFRCFRELAILYENCSMNIANSRHNVHCNLFNETFLKAVPRKLSASKIAFFGEYVVNQLANN